MKGRTEKCSVAQVSGKPNQEAAVVELLYLTRTNRRVASVYLCLVLLPYLSYCPRAHVTALLHVTAQFPIGYHRYR